jgi:hypothetical protein
VHIVENWEDFAHKLTEQKRKALNRWLKTADEKDEKLLKEDIKKVLFNGKEIGKASKKKTEKQNKEIQSLYDDNNKKIERKKYVPKINNDE